MTHSKYAVCMKMGAPDWHHEYFDFSENKWIRPKSSGLPQNLNCYTDSLPDAFELAKRTESMLMLCDFEIKSRVLSWPSEE